MSRSRSYQRSRGGRFRPREEANVWIRGSIKLRRRRLTCMCATVTYDAFQSKLFGFRVLLQCTRCKRRFVDDPQWLDRRYIQAMRNEDIEIPSTDVKPR